MHHLIANARHSHLVAPGVYLFRFPTFCDFQNSQTTSSFVLLYIV